MPDVVEIAPDLYRISVFYPEVNLQFNHFLALDDEPLLFHTGLRRMFNEVLAGVSEVIDPRKLRWISWSHFESDECGALNIWYDVAPRAQAACGMLGALVTVNDFSNRPVRAMTPEDRLATGKRTYRYIHTPHLPHGWDAGVMFEESTKTLLCSDLFHHEGQVEPITTSDILGRVHASLSAGVGGPFADYVPYRDKTATMLHGLAELRPELLATMHGSSYRGNGEKALRDLAVVMKEVLGGESLKDAAAGQ
jgi:flavorubredoxin